MLDPPVNESGRHRGGARVALECLAAHSRHASSHTLLLYYLQECAWASGHARSSSGRGGASPWWRPCRIRVPCTPIASRF